MSRPFRAAFDRVLVVMFENMYRSYVLQNPYMAGLARQGAELVNSYGIFHPSQTNYISSVAGELCGVHDDDPIRPLLPQRTIVDLIEESPRGLTWKAYMQSFRDHAQPWTPDLVPADDFPYLVKHNPFGSFGKIVRSERRWANVGNETDFWRDLVRGELPDFAWFTPNMWNDGHYLDGTQEESDPRAPQLVDQLAAWLEGFFGALRFPGPGNLLPPRTLVVVTFDEADFIRAFEGDKSPYDGPNQIYTVLLGDGVTPGVHVEGSNHYTTLRTIEENFLLGTLGKNDAGSNWHRFLWGERFGWGPSAETPLAAGGVVAAGTADTLVAVQLAAGGALQFATRAGGVWSALAPVGPSASGGLCCWTEPGGVRLVYRDDEDGQLYAVAWTAADGWSETPEAVGSSGSGATAGVSLGGSAGAMLVFEESDGTLSSRVRTPDGWASDEVAVAAAGSSGEFALGRLGASAYLVRRGADGTMGAVSYNTADFNVVTVAPNKYGGPEDNTVVDLWSPDLVEVVHYTDAPSAATPDEPEPKKSPVLTAGALAIGELDGVMHLAHLGAGGVPVQETSLSIGGLMTSAKPYSPGQTGDTSNGFGTLVEASWNAPRVVGGAGAGKPVALARVGDELVLLVDDGEAVHAVSGGYEVVG